MTKGFDMAQMVYDILKPPEPHVIGCCIVCEKEIYKCEEEETEFIGGWLVHTKCKRSDDDV